MHIEQLTDLCDELGFRYIKDAMLKDFTTFRTGGRCPLIICINDTAGLCRLVKHIACSDIKYAVIGKGSNIIADDSGFGGVVLLFGKDFSDISLADDGITLICQSGASMQAVCAKALEQSLTGLEFAWGIPGSIGGGLFMNAGAYGGEIKDAVIYADYVDREGRISRIYRDDMKLSYRHSIFSEDSELIIISIALKLSEGERDNIKSKMDELMARRIQKQPLEYPSAGSTFKRPDGSYASYLIEQCGLKGFSVGDAQVSEKHSGFIINKGSATTGDILKLAEIVRERVKEQTGYILELEPKIIR